MKKLVFVMLLTLMAIAVYSQNLEKGVTLTLHYFALELNQGVTMEKYLDFFNSKYKPAFEKNFQGAKIYLVKGIKGEKINSSGMIIAWKSKATMEKYYNQDGSTTELAKELNTKIKPVQDEFSKLIKLNGRQYTSWEIQ